MVDKSTKVRNQLNDAINQICKNFWLFTERPGKDFIRTRKLPFQKMISFILAMEGGSLTTEILQHFGYSAEIASSSAFVQQRAKVHSEAFQSLFDLFVQKSDTNKRYKGLRLIAADGSDIQIPTNPNHPDSYFPEKAGRSAYSLLHLDAMYDLLQHTYVDAVLLGQRKANERKSLCSMVDRSSLDKALILADRGYENYNLMAHIQEKGWYFLIRIQDVLTSRGIAAGLDLPEYDEFDLPVDLSLTTKQTNAVKRLCKNRNSFRLLASQHDFDYLPLKNKKRDPTLFYKLSFRIVRFKITENSYETVVTNLDSLRFPPKELKKLYNMRWGIETSFRELKYTVGLLHFHSKKVEYICQEIFARLIMYNFAELITSHVVISNGDSKYAYKTNFSVAVHICRQFFLGNVSPPDLEAIVLRNLSPVRPGRSYPRNMSVKHAISFTYRIA